MPRINQKPAALRNPGSGLQFACCRETIHRYATQVAAESERRVAPILTLFPGRRRAFAALGHTSSVPVSCRCCAGSWTSNRGDGSLYYASSPADGVLSWPFSPPVQILEQRCAVHTGPTKHPRHSLQPQTAPGWITVRDRWEKSRKLPSFELNNRRCRL